MASRSPVHKRIKLDPSASPSPSPKAESQGKYEGDETQSSVTLGKDEVDEEPEVPMDVEEDEDHCVICLHHIEDRTVLPCAHDRLCFECILVWTAQSRKCPLCNAAIGPYLIHNLRSKYDYQKHYLPPLRTSPAPEPLLRGTAGSRGRGRPPAVRWGTRARNRSASRERREMEDELALAVERRRWVYRHGLYAKHVASNPYSRYRPAPTPAQISASPDLISRATVFVRRELRVWVNLDVEFLTTFILSLMKTLDLRSESAVKLLAEFLDMDTPYYVGDPSERPSGRFRNAEQFAHELYSYLRSPFRDLATYDSVVQYDIPSDVPPAPVQPRNESRRWDARVRSPRRDEASSRHRDRRYSSPSPVSRSPRDAYSRSPSPVSSDSHGDKLYGPPPPPKSPDRAHNRPAAFTNSADDDGAGRNKKRKGKEPAYLRDDRESRRRDDDRIRQTRSSRRSRSTGRVPMQSGRHGEPLAIEEGKRRKLPSNAPEFARRERDVSRDLTDLPGDHDGQPDKHVNPEALPATSDEAWGISIRGQAKRQAEHQDPDQGGQSEVAGPGKPKPVIGVSRNRTRNPLSLDVLHAHLGRGPTAREGGARNAVASDAATTGVTKEFREAVVTQSLEDDSSQVPSNGETQRLSLSSRLSNPSPSTTPNPISLPSQTSAPEIMARTRAKLAKLRSQHPIVDVTPGVSRVPSGAVADEKAREVPPPALNINMRARLLERLEEEKNQAPQLQGVQGSAVFDRPPKDRKGDQVKSSEGVNIVQQTEGEGVLSAAQQAEVKLRAQALLRVRLAAEKRKAEAVLEEELKARLLSRRN